jgi:hypothetical protein
MLYVYPNTLCVLTTDFSSGSQIMQCILTYRVSVALKMAIMYDTGASVVHSGMHKNTVPMY